MESFSDKAAFYMYILLSVGNVYFLFYSILFYSILFYSILLYSIPYDAPTQITIIPLPPSPPPSHC